MAEIIPLKLINLGDGNGKVQEYQPGDIIHPDHLPPKFEYGWSPTTFYSSSGSSFNISIPADVNEISLAIMLNLSSAGSIYFRLGDLGGIKTSGYESVATSWTGGTPINLSDRFQSWVNAVSHRGELRLIRHVSTNQNWFINGTIYGVNTNNISVLSGLLYLPNMLTTINFSTPGSFAAGFVGLRYRY